MAKMINSASLSAVLGNVWRTGMIKPHPRYNFGRIPPTILGLFDGERYPNALPADCLGGMTGPYDKVVSLFIDALGWRFIEALLKEKSFVQRFAKHGALSPITSQFPSTTAVHATTMFTGMPVAVHGVPEFNYYEPKLDEVFNPLRYKISTGGMRDELNENYAPIVYPVERFLGEIQKRRIKSHLIQPAEIVNSQYNRSMNLGYAEPHGYVSLADGLTELVDAIEKEQERGYFSYYYDQLDGTNHVRGPSSVNVANEAEEIAEAIEKILFRGCLDRQKKTAVIFFADHGHIDVDPAKVVLMDIVTPGLEAWMDVNKAGRLMTHCGSRRDAFIQLQPKFADPAGAHLQKHLGPFAEIGKVSEMLGEGMFGDPATIGPRLLQRLPQYIVLPKGNNTTWWAGDKSHHFGFHGGLSPQEMVIPFGALEVG